MLDNKALSQLSQLKSDILASKDYANGTVIGSNGKYGFVRTDDGRNGFLSPDKMEKLLPGDKVRVSLITKEDNKIEATLEELLESPTDRFIGTYRTKGKAHFVAPSIDGFNRWIFIPPQLRNKCKEGDLIAAQIVKHPLDDGKAQAKVLERVGRPTDDKIEYKYTRAKYDLSRDFGAKEQAQVKDIEAKLKSDTDSSQHKDLTDIPFVTIDSATTRDMDDAVHISKTESGYQLTVAIADPAEVIQQGSPLARVAQIRAQSVYMMGGVVTMLPTALSNHYLSLEEGVTKLALVCEIQLSNEGKIESSKFCYAKISSRHKLNYDSVAEFIDQGNAEAVPEDCAELLSTLADFAKTRLAYREKHFLVGQDQTDFDYQLNSAGKIESIKAKPKNSAHRLIEEAMVATNICAAELLAEKKQGLFVVNEGFRKDRLGEVKALLKEESIELAQDIETLPGFMALLAQLENSDKAYLLNPLRRMMQFGHPSDQPLPHMGMGLPLYTTVTSPIRRFVDLYNHWALKHILIGTPFKSISEKHLTFLGENIQRGKQAERELFQWLIVQYVEGMIGSEAYGRIRIVTQQGFGVRVDENGIEGFVLFPKKTSKKFDAKRMTLTVGDHKYQLDESVKIKIASIDLEKRRIAFQLADDIAESATPEPKEQ